MQHPVIHSKGESLMVFFNNGQNKRIINSSSRLFPRAEELLKVAQSTGDSMYWDELENLMDRAQHIRRWARGAFKIEDGVLFLADEPIHDTIASRIIRGAEEGANVDSFLKFILNLRQNPSYRSREQLYGFLEACDLPITEDGCFLAYKVIGYDWHSIASGPRGRLPNHIGTEVTEPRHMVDDDPNRTCSAGLHVCSERYAPIFGGWNSGTRMVVVKVNPRDVVSVPTDYGNSKMRVCRYIVMAEIPREDVENRILDRTSVNDDYNAYVEPDPEDFEDYSVHIRVTQVDIEAHCDFDDEDLYDEDLY